MEQNIKEIIIEALREADIMEQGRSKYDYENVLYVAERLSGVPYSWIKEVDKRERLCGAR